MYFKNSIRNNSQTRFSSYAYGIKSDLLNQMISEKSTSRPYYENEYDKLFNEYLDKINNLNYNSICSKFVKEVYNFIPIPQTI